MVSYIFLAGILVSIKDLGTLVKCRRNKELNLIFVFISIFDHSSNQFLQFCVEFFDVYMGR
jgi:hypothetical protein